MPYVLSWAKYFINYKKTIKPFNLNPHISADMGVLV